MRRTSRRASTRRLWGALPICNRKLPRNFHRVAAPRESSRKIIIIEEKPSTFFATFPRSLSIHKLSTGFFSLNFSFEFSHYRLHPLIPGNPDSTHPRNIFSSTDSKFWILPRKNFPPFPSVSKSSFFLLQGEEGHFTHTHTRQQPRDSYFAAVCLFGSSFVGRSSLFRGGQHAHHKIFTTEKKEQDLFPSVLPCTPIQTYTEAADGTLRVQKSPPSAGPHSGVRVQVSRLSTAPHTSTA